jgi:hypothetical protein
VIYLYLDRFSMRFANRRATAAPTHADGSALPPPSTPIEAH